MLFGSTAYVEDANDNVIRRDTAESMDGQRPVQKNHRRWYKYDNMSILGDSCTVDCRCIEKILLEILLLTEGGLSSDDYNSLDLY